VLALPAWARAPPLLLEPPAVPPVAGGVAELPEPPVSGKSCEFFSAWPPQAWSIRLAAIATEPTRDQEMATIVCNTSRAAIRFCLAHRIEVSAVRID
jgi:hypothetical protein